jgi:antitoxin component of RelBE/YafQ-DinJ toxin-antitoxin module
MEKTVLTVKTDKKVKQEAQKTARELGLPLGTIINAYLRELAREKRVLFSVPPTPNKRLQNLLKKIKGGIAKRRRLAKPLTYDEAIEHLDSL